MPGEVRISVTTEVDLAALKKLEDALQAHIANARKMGQPYDALSAQLDGVRKAAAGVGEAARSGNQRTAQSAGVATRAVGELSGQFRSLGTNALRGLPLIGPSLATAAAACGPLIVGLGAVVALIGAGVKGLREFGAAQAATNGLDRALASRSQLSDGYRSRLQGLAGQMSERGPWDETEWVKTFTTLTKFGADGGNIQQTAEAVRNLANFMGGDLAGAATMVGKAMSGNFALFSRYGIHVDEALSKSEQLKQLFEQLKIMGGGDLEGGAKTLNQTLTSIGKNVGDIWKGFGNWLYSIAPVQKALSGIEKFLGNIKSVLPEEIAPVGNLQNRAKNLADAKRLGEMEGMRRAGEAAAEGMGELELSSKKAEEQLRKTVEAIERATSGLVKLSQAQTALDVGRIRLAEARGNISGAEAEYKVRDRQLRGELQELIARQNGEQQRDTALYWADDAAQKRVEKARAAEAEAVARTKEAEQKAAGLGVDTNSVTAEIERLKKEYATALKPNGKRTADDDLWHEVVAGGLEETFVPFLISDGMRKKKQQRIESIQDRQRAEARELAEKLPQVARPLAAARDVETAIAEAQKAAGERQAAEMGVSKQRQNYAAASETAQNNIAALGQQRQAKEVEIAANDTDYQRKQTQAREGLQQRGDLLLAQARGDTQAERRLEWISAARDALKEAREAGLDDTQSQEYATQIANRSDVVKYANRQSPFEQFVTSSTSDAAAQKLAALGANPQDGPTRIAEAIKVAFDWAKSDEGRTVNVKLKR